MGLHIREKENSSGSISVQIIDRTHRQYKVIETVGSSKNIVDIELYLDMAKIRLKELNHQLYPLFDYYIYNTFYSGLNFNFYPTGQGKVRYFLGPGVRIGIGHDSGYSNDGYDKVESSAIKEVFGSSYKKIPASSIKSMLGHCMGAASAIEAISCCLAIKEGLIPPTINYKESDPECDIDCVPNKARKKEVKIALNNGFAFGGNNCCVVFGKHR